MSFSLVCGVGDVVWSCTIYVTSIYGYRLGRLAEMDYSGTFHSEHISFGVKFQSSHITEWFEYVHNKPSMLLMISLNVTSTPA